LRIILDSTRKPSVKAFTAALIATAILYVADTQYNDGKYTQVIEQAMASLVPR
jgi:hypothetical protein